MAASLVCCKVSSTCSPLLATRSKNSIEVLGSLSFSPTTHRRIPSLSTGFISPSIKNKRQPCPLRVRSMDAPAKTAFGFDKMVSGTQCKYYLLGGQGGVGKTSCAASLAVKFANSGHATLVVSTDPAHSLSDSFAQDLTGGTLIQVEAPSPLFALEINPEKAREEFRNASQKNCGTGVTDLMDGGPWNDCRTVKLGELKLGELLGTPPPGLDEAIAISKGHTLRLLFLPDFLDASIGKILKGSITVLHSCKANQSRSGALRLHPVEYFKPFLTGDLKGGKRWVFISIPFFPLHFQQCLQIEEIMDVRGQIGNQY